MAKSKNDLDILGANIAKYRKEKGLTQDKLAELLYISDKTVSKWETGKSGPDILIISDLADVLGVEVDDLLRGTSKKNKDRRITRWLNVVFLCIFIFVTCAFLYIKFNSWNVYDFKSTNENFYVSGYVVSNNYESRVVIDNFISDNYLAVMDDVTYIEMTFFVNNEVVYNFVSKGDADIVSDFLDSVNSISFDTAFIINSKNDFDNVYIELIVLTNDESKDYIISLK
ncbi:MAG: helix-turn-helix domain-containing protein [Candidatus Coprovivens sp.]